jgi:hypothetical protein
MFFSCRGVRVSGPLRIRCAMQASVTMSRGAH